MKSVKLSSRKWIVLRKFFLYRYTLYRPFHPRGDAASHVHVTFIDLLLVHEKLSQELLDKIINNTPYLIIRF